MNEDTLLFNTKEEETEYARKLVFEIVNSAKQGFPYKKLIKELWDIADRNQEVWELTEYFVLSLSRANKED